MHLNFDLFIIFFFMSRFHILLSFAKFFASFQFSFISVTSPRFIYVWNIFFPSFLVFSIFHTLLVRPNKFIFISSTYRVFFNFLLQWRFFFNMFSFLILSYKRILAILSVFIVLAVFSILLIYAKKWRCTVVLFCLPILPISSLYSSNFMRNYPRFCFFFFLI